MKKGLFFLFAVVLSFEVHAQFVNLTRDCENMPIKFTPENLVVFHNYRTYNDGQFHAWFGFINPRTGNIFDVPSTSINGCRIFNYDIRSNLVYCENSNLGKGLGSVTHSVFRWTPNRLVELRGSCDPSKRAPINLVFK